MIRSLVLAVTLLSCCIAAGAQTAPTDNSTPAAMNLGKAEQPHRGVEILSDTQGVDFGPYLQQWHTITDRNWLKRIPKSVNPPTSESGAVAIEFKVLPNGRLMPDSVHLVGRSGDTALDRAAWGALTGSSYPPLPSDFHGPYLELRAYFLYNMTPQ